MTDGEGKTKTYSEKEDKRKAEQDQKRDYHIQGVFISKRTGRLIDESQLDAGGF